MIVKKQVDDQQSIVLWGSECERGQWGGVKSCTTVKLQQVILSIGKVSV